MSFPALSETFILNQITGLIDRGHTVDIYASGPRDDPKCHPDVERYGLIGRTFYMKQPMLERLRGVCRAVLVLAERGLGGGAHDRPRPRPRSATARADRR